MNETIFSPPKIKRTIHGGGGMVTGSGRGETKRCEREGVYFHLPLPHGDPLPYVFVSESDSSCDLKRQRSFCVFDLPSRIVSVLELTRVLSLKIPSE